MRQKKAKATIKQIEYLRDLGYTGRFKGMTKRQAMRLIDERIKRANTMHAELDDRLDALLAP